MRYGAMLDTSLDLDGVIAQAAEIQGVGLHSAWASQIFGWDVLTLLACVGREVDGLELGTAVVPTYPRHPITLAIQALTTQAACGGRLCLGVGLSHQVVIEGVYGYSFERPLRHAREYLSVLMPLLSGEQVSFRGDTLSATTLGPLECKGADPPAVLLAALGPAMLRLAGEQAAGTVTWMTGARTVREHIAPGIRRSAEQAGRPSPRVVVALPAAVTREPDRAREGAGRTFGFYGQLPSYRAMLDREGVGGPADVAIVGSEAEVRAGISAVEEAGATDFVVVPFGHPEERQATLELVGSLGS